MGTRAGHVFWALQALLEPCGRTRYDTEQWGADRRHLPPEQHIIGKLPMPTIERKHLTWRTRLKRLALQTLGFSRSAAMHDAVIGLFINPDAFARVSSYRDQRN
jgi:insertion element IS1 protein InsB